MEQYAPIIFFILWLFLVMLMTYYHSKPSKKIVEKYGQPIKHICGCKGLYSLPTRTFNSTVFIDIYDDFLVILVNNKEIVLNKEYKQFEIYGSIMNSVFEIDNNDKKLQICIFGKDAKYLKDFFDILK